MNMLLGIGVAVAQNTSLNPSAAALANAWHERPKTARRGRSPRGRRLDEVEARIHEPVAYARP